MNGSRIAMHWAGDPENTEDRASVVGDVSDQCHGCSVSETNHLFKCNPSHQMSSTASNATYHHWIPLAGPTTHRRHPVTCDVLRRPATKALDESRRSSTHSLELEPNGNGKTSRDFLVREK